MRNLPQRVGKSAEAIWRTVVLTQTLYRLRPAGSSTLASPISPKLYFRAGRIRCDQIRNRAPHRTAARIKYFQRFRRLIPEGGKIAPRFHRNPRPNSKTRAATKPAVIAAPPLTPAKLIAPMASSPARVRMIPIRLWCLSPRMGGAGCEEGWPWFSTLRISNEEGPPRRSPFHFVVRSAGVEKLSDVAQRLRFEHNAAVLGLADREQQIGR
jgi:hypothetical protein